MELVKKALSEASKRGFVPGLAYVVGDTLKDVECGRKAGIKTIAVATGKYSEDELFECNPNYVLKGL
ncbi:MAG: HAD hydrolase-like protein [Candidatus Micrarchaeota archaeon]|nr:HAD hydrolase-like protein [Candidatus Micrarchaeota archaeon]MDE1848110.1 HAD hydrolase-like protein [Candidatus Micrarchaeota archaeon]MDE1864762.1 HAD hydrolase-like protein [Candidatus Micrarchaeota archaeon]